jgi:hypothetical protein
MLYVNIEQMINQIKFKSVSMKKDVKIILIKQQVSPLPIVLFSWNFAKVGIKYQSFNQ